MGMYISAQELRRTIENRLKRYATVTNGGFSFCDFIIVIDYLSVF